MIVMFTHITPTTTTLCLGAHPVLYINDYQLILSLIIRRLSGRGSPIIIRVCSLYTRKAVDERLTYLSLF